MGGERILVSLFLGSFLLEASGQDLEPIPEIERRLPAAGTVEIDEVIRKELQARVDVLADRVWEVDFKDHAADIGMLVKAVDLALAHDEFYEADDIDLARELLDLARERHEAIDQRDETPWLDDRGLVIRGYRSRIDDSYQPFGLEIPESVDLKKPVPLLVWLHGRGDKVTDLHFLDRCRSKSQAFGGFVADQVEAIILHPFGRQCVGWKHAGEIDVFEAIKAVAADYPVDLDRIALAGFSMGGAGAWHIGGHYRDRFCFVHAGAGFAETREYIGLAEADYPPEYEQTLWKVYDVPNFVRNFLNGPVVAYSGSEDKQKQAADLMAREFAKVGHKLHHVIGEGMAHKYDEKSVAEIWAELRKAWEVGRGAYASEVIWQSPTLRYPRYGWIEMTQLEKHWDDSRLAAKWQEEANRIEVETENVSAFTLRSRAEMSLTGLSLQIGDQELKSENPGFPVGALSLIRDGKEWKWGEPSKSGKRPGMQGPIDDAFMSRFVVVPPDSAPNDPVFARWVEFEVGHFRDRWKALMRAELPERPSGDLDSDDIREANLILWGDPDSNAMLAEIADQLPVKWSEEGFRFRGKSFDANEAVPVLIYPNPLNPDRYVVLNSGLTFREGHDRTNSLQNPKLPDWAIVGFDHLPDELASGRVIEAGFFDENWK
ncbi:MAG: alpha/beta hydrolase-fold protein [Verrucomicrobiota bacterium]